MDPTKHVFLGLTVAMENDSNPRLCVMHAALKADSPFCWQRASIKNFIHKEKALNEQVAY